MNCLGPRTSVDVIIYLFYFDNCVITIENMDYDVYVIIMIKTKNYVYFALVKTEV